MWLWDAHMKHRMRFTLRSTVVEGVLVHYLMSGYTGDTSLIVLDVDGNEINIPGPAIEYWEDLDTGTTNPADVTP